MSARHLGLFLSFALSVSAATSTTWETNGFNDMLKGRISGLSLSAAGTLAPGPSLASNVQLGQSAAWAMTRTPDGAVYVATGHSGKVLRLGSNGSFETVWSAPQAEVFAICSDAKGQVYVGTSPNGAVYRLGKSEARQVWQSPAKYIWNLVAASDGTLFAATGEPGQIFRVGSDGKASLYFDTGQVNVTALALSGSRVLAGTDPNGILYDITGQGKATVLYDAQLPEIRSIAVAQDGTLYIAAMGGGVSSRTTLTPTSATAAAPTAAAPTTSTTITVTEAASDQPSAVAPPQQSSTSASSTTPAAATATTQTVETPGVEKSAIYKIRPSGSIETLRSSKDDNVYDVTLDGTSLLFSTDERGRIYKLSGHETTLLAELADGPTNRLLLAGNALFAAMSNPARVFKLGAPATGLASYESVVHDCTSVARWGRLQSRGDSGVRFWVRTGNSARPDTTWSDWSEPADGLIKSPVARFVQWKAQWPSGSKARLNAVVVPYLPQNGPPAVHSISVSPVATAAASATKATSGSSSAANSSYSITVTDTGDAPTTTATSLSQTVSGQQTTQTQIAWQADDPDSDRLSYSVYFRSEEESGWQLIRRNMYETTLTLDADVFADGRYLFRVVASDAPANTTEFAEEGELISSPVLIDNTPPVVTVGTLTRNGSVLDLDIDAADATSSLKSCEYSLDAGPWQMLEATDGVTDSAKERFHLRLNGFAAGEHLLVFRVRDAASNAGLAKVLVR